MKNKIYALIVTVTLFLSMNGVAKADEEKVIENNANVESKKISAEEELKAQKALTTGVQVADGTTTNAVEVEEVQVTNTVSNPKVAEDLKVGNITFNRLNQIPEDYLREKLPVKSGDKYTNRTLSEIYLAMKRLNYISNVNVYPTIVGDTVNLTLEIDEQANAAEIAQREENNKELQNKTDYIVSKVDIEGIQTLNKDEFLADLPVKVGENFTPQDAIDGAQKIFRSGYFATVEPKVDRSTDNTISIIYLVKENPVIKSVEFSGNTLYTQEQLKTALGVKEGEILNGNLLNPDKNGVIDLYNKNGYTLARIETINVSEEGEARIGLTEGIVDSVTFRKVTSKKDNERRSRRTSELRTQPYVFERSQAVKPGEVFERKNVEATIRELYRTGVFTSIEPVISGKEGDPNARVVEFLVEERPTTTINGSISYGTSVGLVGGIKLADSNFLGKGQEASFNIEASNKGDKTFEVSLFDPWIKGTERVQGGGSIYWKETRDDDAENDEVERVKKLGTRWTIGKGLNDKLFTRVSVRYDRYKEVLANSEVNDKYNLIAITPMLIFDTRDNSFSPSKGVYTTLSYEKGDLLGDSRKYDQFEADLRAYHPTFFKDKNVMAYRVVWGKTGSGTPEALRFSVGGAETIRGYDYGEFDGFDKFHATIENRTKINDTLQLVAFFDIGNAWQNETRINGKKVYSPNRAEASDFKNLKKGYGIGVRLNTPIGPLRFDYGWPLDPVEPGKKKTSGKFYFSFGQTF